VNPSPDFYLFPAALAFLAGCAHVEPCVEPCIATLYTTGDAVFLNGAKAADQSIVRAGDTVSTGPASSALIEYADGGYMQLDENTDPKFRFEPVERGARKCIYVYIEIGQVLVDKDLLCVETPQTKLALGSQVDIKVTQRESTVAVLRGKATLTAPGQYMVPASYRAVVAKGDPKPDIRELSEIELRELTMWRGNYYFSSVIRNFPVPRRR
jgi:ferric-dicitrate binding protein FerR (iron transport regulator)